MKITLALSALLLAAPAAALAQAPAAPTVVRGTVTAVTDGALSIRTDKGPVQVVLAPTWIVSVMKPVAIDAIQSGSFIGTAEMPSKDGSTGTSMEVHVFPPGVKMGEGHYAWDLKPGSMMTNGTVGTVVAGKAGSRELDVSFPSGQRHVTVPADVPVVQIAGGARDLVKVGTPVFLLAQRTPAGALATNAVSVGGERRQAADVTPARGPAGLSAAGRRWPPPGGSPASRARTDATERRGRSRTAPRSGHPAWPAAPGWRRSGSCAGTRR